MRVNPIVVAIFWIVTMCAVASIDAYEYRKLKAHNQKLWDHNQSLMKHNKFVIELLKHPVRRLDAEEWFVNPKE